jgi:hypothetical protein
VLFRRRHGYASGGGAVPLQAVAQVPLGGRHAGIETGLGGAVLVRQRGRARPGLVVRWLVAGEDPWPAARGGGGKR